jgi:hypothetical protein
MSYFYGKPPKEIDLSALEKAAAELHTQKEIAVRLKISTKKLYQVLETISGRAAYERGHKSFLESQKKVCREIPSNALNGKSG